MKTSRNGFTLIEVLVALAILAMSLGAIMVALRVQSARIEAVAERSEALQIAQSLLAATGTALPLRRGEQSGVTEDGYSWRLKISPWGDDDDIKSRSIPAYLIEVEVARRGRPAVLSTLRAGP